MSISDATIAFMKRTGFPQTVAPLTPATYPFLDLLGVFVDTTEVMRGTDRDTPEQMRVVAESIVRRNLSGRSARDKAVDLISINAFDADVSFSNSSRQEPARIPWRPSDRMHTLLFDVYLGIIVHLSDADIEARKSESPAGSSTTP